MLSDSNHYLYVQYKNIESKGILLDSSESEFANYVDICRYNAL